MAIHSSIPAWRIPWTEEPGGQYSPWGRKESNMTERAHRQPSEVLLLFSAGDRAHCPSSRSGIPNIWAVDRHLLSDHQRCQVRNKVHKNCNALESFCLSGLRLQFLVLVSFRTRGSSLSFLHLCLLPSSMPAPLRTLFPVCSPPPDHSCMHLLEDCGKEPANGCQFP